MTIDLYRDKRRWKFDVLNGGGSQTILFGADNFLDRLSQFAEAFRAEISTRETGGEGELALVSVAGSDLRGWRLFRRRDGDEFGFLSPALLELLGHPHALFLRRVTSGTDAAPVK